jgi:hypothetical protein
MIWNPSVFTYYIMIAVKFRMDVRNIQEHGTDRSLALRCNHEKTYV